MTSKLFKDIDLAGFRKERLYRFDPVEIEVTSAELLLPETREFKGSSRASLVRAESAREEFTKKDRTPEEDGALPTRSPPANNAWGTKNSKDLNVDEERGVLSARLDDDELLGPPKHAQVYEWAQPLIFLNTTKTPDRDALARNKKLYSALRDKGNFRKLARPDNTAALQSLEALRLEHPNFAEVIGYVRDQLLLSQRVDRPPRLAPILLLGPPGVGKTHFCNSLAAFMGSPIHRLAFDSAQKSSALLGNDKHWGNTSSGMLFDAICLGDFANPVLFLDEIDKTSEGGNYQHPLASLHTLLEPVSSARVKDISLDFEFDASHVIWIAAANDPSNVPLTVRSRFTEFHIEAPKGHEALQLAKVLASKTHAAVAIEGFREPEYALVRQLAHLTPREQRQAWERAYATAVANGRNHLSKSDLPRDVLCDAAPDAAEGGAGWLH